MTSEAPNDARSANDLITGEAQNDGRSPNKAKQMTGEAQNDLITNDSQKLNDAKQMTSEAQIDGRSPSGFPGWYYEMQSLGFNYRLTDFQAALGNSQLKRAGEGLERRKEIAKTYFEAFKDKPFIKRQSGVVEGHAYHLYVIEAENRKGLYEHLRANNIFAQIHYVPVHLMPYYKQFGWKKGDFPVAEKYYSQCISLPMYPTLTNEEQTFVITCITNFYNKK